MAITLEFPARKPLCSLPDKRQSQLSSKELVIGKPLPCRMIQSDIARILRIMQCLERLAMRWQLELVEDWQIDPFRHFWGLGECFLNAARQHFGRKPRSQGIDGLDQWERCSVFDVGNVIGMDHGRTAIEPFHSA